MATVGPQGADALDGLEASAGEAGAARGRAIPLRKLWTLASGGICQMSDAYAVIQRCTRDGAVMWGQVAKQLGISVDKARRLYEPTSSARHDPQQLAEPEPMTDAQAYKSPHPKGQGFKTMILGLLERHGRLSVEDMARRIGSTPSSIRRFLGELVHAGLCQSDNAGDKCGRSWSLTEAGKTTAKAQRERPGKPNTEIGPRAASDIGQAA